MVFVLALQRPSISSRTSGLRRAQEKNETKTDERHFAITVGFHVGSLVLIPDYFQHAGCMRFSYFSSTIMTVTYASCVARAWWQRGRTSSIGRTFNSSPVSIFNTFERRARKFTSCCHQALAITTPLPPPNSRDRGRDSGAHAPRGWMAIATAGAEQLSSPA